MMVFLSTVAASAAKIIKGVVLAVVVYLANKCVRHLPWGRKK